MAWQAVEFDDAAKKRIKQAAEFEKTLRLEAFLNIPSECGNFKLRIPTIRDIIELEFSKNRFFTNQIPQTDDYIHLLWMLKPKHDKRKEKKFANQVSRQLTEKDRAEIEAFLSCQFLTDCPSSGESVKNNYDSSVSMATLIDLLCSEYGWPLEQAMSTPLLTAFQLLQRIIKRNNKQYAIRNGITQQAKAEEMKKNHA